MQFITTVTQKGQITLHKSFRDSFGIMSYDRVSIHKGNGFLKIVPAKDILDLAGTFEPKKRVPALVARKTFEEKYKRF